MIKLIGKLLCKIGRHRWKENFGRNGRYQSYERVCSRCLRGEFMNMYPGSYLWIKKPTNQDRREDANFKA
jgi:hypothetical protein